MDREDGTSEFVEVLDLLTEMKIKVREMKGEIESRVKQRQEVERFQRENKLKALPKLTISPLT